MSYRFYVSRLSFIELDRQFIPRCVLIFVSQKISIAGQQLWQGPPTISTNLVAWKVYTFNGLESAEPSIILHDKNTELKQKP